MSKTDKLLSLSLIQVTMYLNFIYLSYFFINSLLSDKDILYHIYIDGIGRDSHDRKEEHNQ